MRKPDLNVQEWAVVSSALHIVAGYMLQSEVGHPTDEEMQPAWDEMRDLLEAEWGHAGAESDEMLQLRETMEQVWLAALPALKAARPRRIRQPDLFEGG